MILTPCFPGTERFQVVRTIGVGGMGSVYEVVDREQSTRVALKVLRYSDPRLVYRFKREFRALQGLRHPNLVSLGELFEDDDLWYFTMELVRGVDLGTYIAGANDALHDAMPGALADGAAGEAQQREERLRSAFSQLVDGVEFLHEMHIVHRDLKPSNVLVDDTDRLVLLDFGLVAEMAPDLVSQRISPVGTPAYMAPEQARSGEVGPPADWYAVGVMLYEALTGRLPVDGTPHEMMMRKQDQRPTPPDAIARVPADLSRLCMRLLAIDPADRPEAHAIRHALGDTPSGLYDLDVRRSAPRVFVGRERELSALVDMVASPHPGGAPAMISVEADSGLGKTTLLARAIDDIRQTCPDALVFAGRCYDNESVNFRGVDVVIDAIARHLWSLDTDRVTALIADGAAHLARMFPVFDTVDGIAARRAPRALDEVQAKFAAIEALRALLRGLCADHRVVIAIDDMQWTDNDSLVLLAELVRGPGAPPIVLIAATRPISEATRHAASWQRLRETVGDNAYRLRLGPLAKTAAEHLARQLMGSTAPPARIVGAVREARGHPLYIAELARHADAFGELPPDAHGLDVAIVSRVGDLTGPSQQLAQLIALAGAPVRTRTLRRALDATQRQFDRALATLRTQHLARTTVRDTVEPYHDRVRRALLGAIDADELRRLHECLAIAMLAAGDPPDALIRHLEGAGRYTRAADCAVEAARRAAGALAFDRAADLYRTALRLGEYSDSVERALRKDLADALVAAGRGYEAALVFSEAAEGADPAQRMEYRRQAAEQLLITGYIQEGLEVLESLLHEIDTPLPATPRRALLSLIRQRLALALGGVRWTVRRETEIPRETLVRLDVYRVVSHGLSMVDNIRGADFNARYLRLALRTGEPVRLCRALGIEAVFNGSQGGRGLRRARYLHRRIDELATTDGDAYARAYVAGVDGVLSYFEGRFSHAAARLRESEALFNDVHVLEGYERSNVRMFRAFSLMQAGEYPLLADELRVWTADADRRGDHYLAASLFRACNLVWLTTAGVAEARRNLARARWIPPEGRFHLQHWFGVLGRGEIALTDGAAADYVHTIDGAIAAMRAAMLMRIQMVRTEAYWLQARLHLAAATTPDQRRRAVALARRNRRRLAREPLHHARTLAAMLDVNIASVAKDRAELVRALRRVITAGSADTPYPTVARARLAQLLTGDESEQLEGEAYAWLCAKRVDSLRPLLTVFTPCLDERPHALVAPATSTAPTTEQLSPVPGS